MIEIGDSYLNAVTAPFIEISIVSVIEIGDSYLNIRIKTFRCYN